MKYDIDELPLNDFALLGLEKTDILSLPPQTLGALLNGGRTSLIRFKNIKTRNGRKYYLDARLSLDRDKLGKLKLHMHPRRPELKNSFGLNPDEIKYLEQNPNGFLKKDSLSEPGKKLSVYRDTLTNEYIAIDNSRIKSPIGIDGEKLTQAQQAQFNSGEPISIGDTNMRLDPLAETGITENGIRRIDFTKYSYSKPEKFFDLTLLSLGLGKVILLEHIIRFVLLVAKNDLDYHNLQQNNRLSNALMGAHSDILSKKEELGIHNKSIQLDDIKKILKRHLNEQGLADTISTGLEESPNTLTSSKSNYPGQNISVANDGSVLSEILALPLTGIDPKLQTAIAETKSQLNQFKSLGGKVPDAACIILLTHYLERNGFDTSGKTIQPGEILETLKSLKQKIILGPDSQKLKM
jgi:hypothetical protein